MAIDLKNGTDERLHILPPYQNTIPVVLKFATFGYSYGDAVDEYGDREVVDEERDCTATLHVPQISFIEWVDTLISLKNKGVAFRHDWAKEIVPYKQGKRHVWCYFDKVQRNMFYKERTFPIMDLPVMFVYHIKDLDSFVITRLDSHRELVWYQELV